MKKQALTLIGVLSLLLAVGSAWAQGHDQAVRANIPFKFVVNKQAMPAGEYEIGRFGNGGDVLLIHGVDTNTNMLVASNSAQSLNPADATKLIFKRYGDRYFLSQVWIAGNRSGRQLPKSAHETEVAMDFSSTNVIVLASLR